MNSTKAVQVVAALIWQGDRFMACQRPAHKARGLLWEFVGGKIEPGETGPKALARECREELDIQVSVGSPVMTVTHQYPDMTVELTLYESYILNGEPKLLEHCDLRWITVDEIDDYPFCPADEVILDWLKKNRGRPLTPAESLVRARLFALSEPEYGDFHSRLMPNIPRRQVIGVRLPLIKKLAKELAKTPQAEEFCAALPHRYYEENNLHGLLAAEIRQPEQLFAELERFLPFVDNWATCDSIRPVLFKKHPAQLMDKIKHWLCSEHPYTVRFGLEMLMTYYLDETFEPWQLELAASVKREEYYVRMMQAWYFATALAKQWDAALPYIENRRLGVWVHNKTIQKSAESFRVPPEHKEILKKLKIQTKENPK